ncbi:MAG TPA: GGDEF domain-containing protein [Polyangiaceae bacterium]|nr:GGDEF domain-containing protein [Polyangiaceae bacterium]
MSDDPKKTAKQPFVPEGGSGDLPALPRPSIPEWTEEEPSTRTTVTGIPAAPASAPQKTRAMLTIISGSSTGRTYSVGDGETVIGRGKEVAVRLDDAGASRTHARILAMPEGRYVVEDLGSTNGTFVDSRRADKPLELKSGDRIHIGPNVTVTFAIMDAQAERIAQQLYESSVRDTLTRAHNRRYLLERISSEIAYARRHSTPLALIMFDIDHFKRINDTYGHLAGDDALREIASLMQRMIRAEDVFARYGGEEFVVVVRGIRHHNVGRFAERLRVAVERLEVVSEATVLRLTISLGYASLDEIDDAQRTVDGIIRLADARLYAAKAGGRNRTSGS